MNSTLKMKDEEKVSYRADEIECLGKGKEEEISKGKHFFPTFFVGWVGGWRKVGPRAEKIGNGFWRFSGDFYGIKSKFDRVNGAQ